ncbi:monomeric [FeFe] hydrogenase [Saccharicrinis fermentans]|uniref:Iron hydrogenase 1 n=1 Tax=Saccharicrinis fermentans DSM 9555 = JCM 21142 TaxID=869213 RepID=W7YAX1_9BACT|nr:monomeric [FeFe] hydrogenase [Saccharicrinis fermentans]GAF01511.1 iron hydrogenase 1 [Saccharicrinis fermentans DSM 9555 = JCM 21142]
MTYFNNAIQTKRELQTTLIKLLKEDRLIEKIDRIPLEMRPKSKTPIRCCVHKDRAVIKYKSMAIMGFCTEDEEDELTPLSEYAQKALDRTGIPEEHLTVIDEACSSCVQVNYTVSNLCQGCAGRACQVNCPKDAIRVVNGKAMIDNQKCVNCGLCQKACPFHAIAYLPVPCEEACPVKAIKKNEEGIEVIDMDKCIYCGKCMTACPFGAVMEKSQIIQLAKVLKSHEEAVAMVAPAILGQFKASPEQIMGALKAIGFTHVMEVAEGADITAKNETEEWIETVQKKDPFLTSSCCPAHTLLSQKHLKELQPYVSHTKSPMLYAAELAEKKFPKAKRVFIGPCLAKRHEASQSGQIDFVLTFEELNSFFTAYEIDFATAENVALMSSISAEARGFAISGGVAEAIKHSIPNGYAFQEFLVDGLNQKNIKLLSAFSKKAPDYNFIEVMGCEGGCINGPGSITAYKTGTALLKKAIKAQEGATKA